ncbi:aminotransferase class I/II-fold pyridoxal phosphate-dependent enzyme [Epidermidibacterium keratini]|uniref:Aminotransferase n=1 Tax=Epidermidibacterium keratini TaxID=1891644 RepID=A0A7L4YN89_9ACTN|nr:pyridoxal phosphate-dependent aminotransferase [Epidermidibacterium keratini]QHC00620.1 aminotransferase class I/II-fold pyridoxal phosphate-dependent enzyme [Epidermidibacterium keratini]
MSSPASLSPTLAINEEIARRRASGLPVIALGFGEASVPVLPELVDRLREHAWRAAYGPVAGVDELRESIAGYLKRRDIAADPQTVVAAPGSKPILFAIIRALAGPIGLPRPSWVSYAAHVELAGFDAPRVPALAGEGGLPDPDELDTLAAARRAEGRPLVGVLITLVDNPTGTCASPEAVRRLCDVAERHGLAIVSDEIYRDVVHPGQPPVVSPAAIAPDISYVTGGLSKSLAVGGWRLGFARFPSTADGQRVQREATRAASEIWSAAAMPVQYAAAWALEDPPQVQARIADANRLHGVVANEVTRRFVDAGAEVTAPTGAFYLYPRFESGTGGAQTSEQLAGVLLDEHGVATLPGTAFGDLPERLTLRIATPMLYGQDLDQRQAALDADDPLSLPWIAADLDAISIALAAVTAGNR